MAYGVYQNQGCLLRLNTLDVLHCKKNVVSKAIISQILIWHNWVLAEDEVATLLVRGGGKDLLCFLQSFHFYFRQYSVTSFKEFECSLLWRQHFCTLECNNESNKIYFSVSLGAPMQMLGNFLSGFVMERFGRKRTIIFSCVLVLVSSAILSFATKYEVSMIKNKNNATFVAKS